MSRRPKGPTARRRAAKRRKLDAVELANMKQARFRDEVCRFPVCGCLRRQSSDPASPFRFEVSHQQHRGMGGDPGGERSHPSLLVLLCNWRHKLSKFSIDRHGIRWEALTDQGADGPIRWLIDLHFVYFSVEPVLPYDGMEPDESGDWLILAEETALHAYKPFTPAQSAILSWLAEMTV